MKFSKHFGLISIQNKRSQKIQRDPSWDSLVKDEGKDVLKKCFMLKICEVSVCLETWLSQEYQQHLGTGMHVWTHRHQRPIPGGKFEASSQERTSNNGTVYHWASYMKSQTPLPKAATVTSQPEAGKSCFGSWQKKFSRSLALTSCCHWADKLREQPHTASHSPPQGQVGFSRTDCTSSHFRCANPDCLLGLSMVHIIVFKYPCTPAPIHHHLSCRMSPQQLLIAAGKTTVSAVDRALSTDQHFLYSTSQSPVNFSPAWLHPGWDA